MTHYTVKTIPVGERLLFEYENKIEAKRDIIIDEEKCLVGAEIYGNDTANLINVLTFAINQKVTDKGLFNMIFAYSNPSSSVLGLLKFMLL